MPLPAAMHVSSLICWQITCMILCAISLIPKMDFPQFWGFACLSECWNLRNYCVRQCYRYGKPQFPRTHTDRYSRCTLCRLRNKLVRKRFHTKWVVECVSPLYPILLLSARLRTSNRSVRLHEGHALNAHHNWVNVNSVTFQKRVTKS